MVICLKIYKISPSDYNNAKYYIFCFSGIQQMTLDLTVQVTFKRGDGGIVHLCTFLNLKKTVE